MNKRRVVVIGIDVGTSSCKVVLVSEAGNIVARGAAEYGLTQPQPGWVEQDPAEWVRGVQGAIRTALEDAGDKVEIAAVGLTGQMHGMTPLGSANEVLRPAILWNDQRNAAECEAAIATVGGPNAVRQYTNNDLLVGYTAGKILWLQKHEPHVFQRLRLVLNPKDYIRLLLTGERATDVSDASGTGLFDVRRRQWSGEFFDKVGLEQTLLPRCYESTEVTGQVNKYGEELFRIPQGVPVVGGGGDSVTQTLGSGVVDPGEVETNVGTGGVTAAALERCTNNLGSGLQVFCNVVPDKWHAMGVAISAGFALRWFRGIVQGSDVATHHWTYDEITALADCSVPGANGLIFIPYLNGERAPHPDPDARAAFVGLTGLHNRSDMARAVMEGVAFELYDMYRLLQRVGVTASVIKASGGGAKSPMWRQLQADVFGCEVVTTVGAVQGSAFGAALVAALGIGLFKTVNEAAACCCVTTRQHPRLDVHERMCELFTVYRGLYDALFPSFKRLSAFGKVDAPSDTKPSEHRR